MDNNYNFDPMTGERIIREEAKTENAAAGAQNQENAAANAGNREAAGETVRSSYAESQSATWVTSYGEEEKESKKARKAKSKEPKAKKPWGFFKKAGAAVVLAAVFGGVAGGTFYGICYGTGLLDKYEQAISVSQTEQKRESTPIKQVEVNDDTNAVKITNLNGKSVITTDISAMVDEVIPAMVTIVNTGTTTQYDFWGRTYSSPSQSSGSGIIIGQNDDELLIVTNHHVAEAAEKLEITFIDNNKAEARVKGMDSEMDLAVIAVDLNELSDETKAAISIAKLGDSDSLKLGEPAIVIGNALGIGISVTNGVISGLNREMTREDGVKETFIQTDAAINHGNSGGALLNINGEVVGITSGKLGGTDVDNMGYAIPISAADPIIKELMEHETRKEKVAEEEQGYLGVSLQNFDDTARSYYNIPEGAFVYGVYEGSGAEKAGIYKGDVITKLENEKVRNISDIKAILQYYKQGDVVKIVVKRLEAGEYVEHEFDVTLCAESIMEQAQ